MKRKKHLYAALVCILILILPIFSNASEKKIVYGLTMECEVIGTEISLYRIAGDIQKGNYNLQDPFKTYRSKVEGLENLDTLDSEGWRSLASTLEECVIADQIEADYTQKVSEAGSAVFDDILKGVYLITGSRIRGKDVIYTPSPMIITIPRQMDTGAFEYHPTVKYNKIEKEQLKTTKKLEVIKIWKDSDAKEKRPSEVTIELLRDGKKHKTIKLNAKNNWKYQWENLSADYRWTIIEKDVPSSYRVEYSKTGNKIYVVNHYKKSEKPDKPKTPEKTPEKSEASEPPKVQKLPQTGQLWWPVPILAVLGIIVWMIGWIKRRISYDA